MNRICNISLFSIPVYRCSETQYKEDLAREIAKSLKDCMIYSDKDIDSICREGCLEGQLKSSFAEELIVSYKRIRDRVYSENSCFFFNQVVAYFKLSLINEQLSIGHYEKDFKKDNLRNLRKFDKLPHKYNIRLNPSDTNSAIFNTIIDRLKKFEEIAKKGHPKRVVDYTEFFEIARFIDWQTLLLESSGQIERKLK